MLRPGLQLLRPPKRDARDGQGIVAGFVAYNTDAFKDEFAIEPWQVCRTSRVNVFNAQRPPFLLAQLAGMDSIWELVKTSLYCCRMEFCCRLAR